MAGKVTRREMRLMEQEMLVQKLEAEGGIVRKRKGHPASGLKKWVFKLVWPTGHVEERITPWGEKQRVTRAKKRRLARLSRKVNQQRAAKARRARQKRHRRCA